MTIPEVLDAMQAMEERGIKCVAGDEVGLMRAKKLYRSIGLRENYDFYIHGGQVYFSVYFRPGTPPLPSQE